jgi:hypothetical protein
MAEYLPAQRGDTAKTGLPGASAPETGLPEAGYRPWTNYRPAIDPNTGLVTLDAAMERAYGLTYSSLRDRLQQTGITEEALKNLLDLAFNKEVSDKVRLEATRTILAHGFGNPTPNEQKTSVQVMIVNDMQGGASGTGARAAHGEPASIIIEREPAGEIEGIEQPVFGDDDDDDIFDGI